MAADAVELLRKEGHMAAHLRDGVAEADVQEIRQVCSISLVAGDLTTPEGLVLAAHSCYLPSSALESQTYSVG